MKRFTQGVQQYANTSNNMGIFDVVQAAVQKLGFSAIKGEQCTKLVDGPMANIASAGLKGLVEKELLWVLWMAVTS